MKVTVARPSELGRAEHALWQQFQRASPHLANPFLTADFAVAVDGCRDDARVAVVCEGSRIIAFWPFQAGVCGRARPIGAAVSDAQGIVHAPDAFPEPEALLRGARVSEWRFDHLLGEQALAAPQRPMRLVASPLVDLSHGWEAYAASRRSMGSRVLADTARRERKLAREVGTVSAGHDVDPGHALSLMWRWKSAQYRSTGLWDRSQRRWIVDLVERLQALPGGWFSPSLDVLAVDGRPVAVHFGIRTEQVLCYWFPAFDRELAPYSPGRQLLVRLLRRAAEEGLPAVDLGRGDEAYKQRFKTGDRVVADGVFARRGLGMLVGRVERWARAAARGSALEAPARWAARRMSWREAPVAQIQRRDAEQPVRSAEASRAAS